MRLKPSTYFAISIMIAMVFVIGKALTFNYFQTAFLPILIGSFVFIIAGIQVGREILSKEEGKAEEKTTFGGEEIVYTKGIGLSTFAAWFLGLCLAVYLLGHLIAVSLFSISYVKWRGKRWVNAIAASACITAFIYILFPFFFKTELYPGLITELLWGG